MRAVQPHAHPAGGACDVYDALEGGAAAPSAATARLDGAPPPPSKDLGQPNQPRIGSKCGEAGKVKTPEYSLKYSGVKGFFLHD